MRVYVSLDRKEKKRKEKKRKEKKRGKKRKEKKRKEKKRKEKNRGRKEISTNCLGIDKAYELLRGEHVCSDLTFH